MKELIKTQVEVNDWEQAITEAGKLLLNCGSITEKYIENMINSVKQLGPYIVIAPYIAIAHARPDESVFKEDISLIILKNPVEFGNKDNDPVKLVFAFAAKENGGHLAQLAEIANVLGNEELMNNIIASSSEEAVYNIINGREVN
ncbi:PTS sugar transporter subunit IIA [Clostridium sp. YIM B02515]|uniref:Ascorbate-specific PTS system EIIA component n=1 Tax=Clostridium rhizosphaerae TaxID=2803861 RepID=A0ABS1TAA6_9CLOT|nr:PTS sugar transporter subunit IIA [Clostridium rhizosphaerae]MBL4936206.1 PTS sugar transporter subunit IIA [Clostridium rhizosphaerae]